MKTAFNYDIEDLKPIGKVPDLDGWGSLAEFGISPLFWQQIVVPTLKRRFNNQCCLCSSDRFLEVHHKNYEEQNINNLFLVCKSCHTEIHNSNLNNKDFIELHNKGLNDEEVSKELEVSVSSVFRRRHKLIGGKNEL
jgi:hypothetical protein